MIHVPRRRALLHFILATTAFSIGPMQQASLAQTVRWEELQIDLRDPGRGLPQALRRVRYRPTDPPGHYLVQVTGPLSRAQTDSLAAAGATLQRRVDPRTMLVRIPFDRASAVQALGFVRNVAVYQPGHRLSRGLRARLEGRAPGVSRMPRDIPPVGTTTTLGDSLLPSTAPVLHPTPTPTPPAEVFVRVLLFPGEDAVRVYSQIQGIGGVTRQSVDRGRWGHMFLVRVQVARLADLAAINGVERIEEHAMAVPLNDRAHGVTRVDWLQNDYAYIAPFLGDGQIIAIADTGLDKGVDDATMHADFQGQIESIVGWPVQDYDLELPGEPPLYPNNVGEAPKTNDDHRGHGTHVAGTAMGNGALSTGKFRGAAPDAHLFFQAVEQWVDVDIDRLDGYYLHGIPADLGDLFQQAYDAGARIHSNSWGAWGETILGTYTDRSAQLDQFVWEHPDMLILAGAGNYARATDATGHTIETGTITPPATAKNCIAVGASENSRNSVLMPYGVPPDGTYGDRYVTNAVADNKQGIAPFSGRGLVTGDRIKPDLVAPGTLIVSTRAQGMPRGVYFQESMESTSTDWIATGSWARVSTDAATGSFSWHDSPGGNYPPNTVSTLTRKNLDFSSVGDACYVWFNLRKDLGTGDQFTVELVEPVSDHAENLDFEFPATETVDDWAAVPVSLDGHLGAFTAAERANLSLRFSLVSDNDGVEGDGVYLDDLLILDPSMEMWGTLSQRRVAVPGSVEDLNYVLNGGTSMATPLVAGAAAIIREYYMDVVGLDLVSAALIRATLINGAVDVQPGQFSLPDEVDAYPDENQGWGRLNVKKCLFPPDPAVVDFVDAVDGLSTGDVRTYTIDVTDASTEFAATMVYHDYPGASLQNHLDLKVVDPAGIIHFPNGLTAGPDEVNNVEQVYIEPTNVLVGTYTLSVEATSIPFGPQPFALVTRAGGGTMTQRPPVDIAVVLDRSGSMSLAACPGGCDSRMEVLKDAVEIFTGLWGALANSEDRVALTHFSTDVTQFDQGGAQLIPFLAGFDAVRSEVQSLTPSGLTAMGGGLQSAINLLEGDSRPRHIVLFSDGMQNVNPKVRHLPNPVGFDLEISNDPSTRISSNVPPRDPPTRLDGNLGITVSTLGIGSTDPYLERLEEIATKTGGKHYATQMPDADLRQFFVEDLLDFLGPYSPQLVEYSRGRLTSDSVERSFEFNKSADRVLFKLSHRSGAKLQLQVFKGATDVTAGATHFTGSVYQILSFDTPFDRAGTMIEAEGTWRLQIRGAPGTTYELAAIADEPLLDYSVSVGGGALRVDDPLRLELRLHRGGVPIVEGVTATATVLKPGSGMGTLLSEGSVSSPPPDAFGVDVTSLSQWKLTQLMEKPEFYSALRPNPNQVVLRQESDGSYVGRFAATDVPGNYVVRFEIEGNHPQIGHFVREKTVTSTVGFGAALFDQSRLRRQALDPAGNREHHRISLRPRDVHGNFLGPDYADQIRIELDGVPIGPIQDRADGSYAAEVVFDAGRDPTTSVFVLEEKLFDEPFREIPPEVSPWSLSAHIGATQPLGSLDKSHDPSLLWEVDVAWRFAPRWSVLGIYGTYSFDPELDIQGGTLYARRLFDRRAVDVFVELGAGAYKPDDIDLAAGLSAGVGVRKRVAEKLHAELAADYFYVFSTGDDIDFMAWKVGISREF